MLTQDELKQQAAQAALDHVLPQLQPDSILGVGTGSTVDRFIDLLAPHRQEFRAAVSSSERSTRRLRAAGIEVLDLNDVAALALYVDGADEIDPQLNMVKGGGGALTREKIVASVADRFVCIVDESKLVERLGAFPLPIEVIPLAREAVARQVRQLGGQPCLREGFVTDNGNQILDVSGLNYGDPAEFEALLNNIPGVVCCGLFAISGAQVALVAGQDGVSRLELLD
ncbi:Ribose 5-phosphate isomerase A [Castellaniella defragrans 65Phen]|uniref:Ribose-5-phosphate isomerase A n=2 Tax=Castellaniella defragrans TaxID=75697 RepID=W8X9J3_CASD6|nr:ribose-5-phosphate isomerase RpiA [Castellaniella defragrans]KAB0622205.1 ribose-5-phosphate isomerase RpiA [Castellaniella defragrans]MBB6085082.1 ribose 5-phosphate isomerase A [Castellaniella defragrans]CDM24925.1 Ribose 5-phosphate isomerase A [Castellaniella defragrans 65Phen]